MATIYVKFECRNPTFRFFVAFECHLPLLSSFLNWTFGVCHTVQICDGMHTQAHGGRSQWSKSTAVNGCANRDIIKLVACPHTLLVQFPCCVCVALRESDNVYLQAHHLTLPFLPQPPHPSPQQQVAAHQPRPRIPPCRSRPGSPQPPGAAGTYAAAVAAAPMLSPEAGSSGGCPSGGGDTVRGLHGAAVPWLHDARAAAAAAAAAATVSAAAVAASADLAAGARSYAAAVATAVFVPAAGGDGGAEWVWEAAGPGPEDPFREDWPHWGRRWICCAKGGERMIHRSGASSMGESDYTI
jgi:hypothetical protein